MKLSIVIPVFNEESTLEWLLRRVLKAKLPLKFKKEIIIVDDASTDGSYKLSQLFKKNNKRSEIKLIKHVKNQGKGASVVDGLRVSTGEIVIIQDADLEYNPDDYQKLIEPILKMKTDIVYGTRLKNYPLKLFGKNKTPLVTHYLGNKFLTLITEILYQQKVSDMETCYKVFRKKVLNNIQIKARRFDFEPEFTAKILKSGYKIYEVPIRVKPRGYDEGKKISWHDGFIALWTLIKYRFID